MLETSQKLELIGAKQKHLGKRLRIDFLRFETLECPAIVLKFIKNFLLSFHYFVLGLLYT